IQEKWRGEREEHQRAAAGDHVLKTRGHGGAVARARIMPNSEVSEPVGRIITTVHAHGNETHERRLLVVLCLAVAYLVTEVIGGLLTGSLALLADSGHLLTDVLGLGMAVAAIRFARRPATPGRTYGFYRTEILAALVN